MHEEMSGGDGYFYYFDCGDGFMGVCTFLICTVNISIIIKLFKKYCKGVMIFFLIVVLVKELKNG